MSEARDKNATLWQVVADAQDSVVRDHRALERLRGVIVQPREPRIRWPRFAWPAGLAAVAAVAVWSLSWRQPSFRVGGNEGAVGVVLSAELKQLPVRFADGSEVVLSPGSRGQVHRLSESGAEVVLSGGSLEAHVVHSADTRWVFHAGPFQILVTGTRFIAAWNAEVRRLTVRMTEGSVRIGGGGLQADVPVRAGQEFTASQGDQHYALSDVASSQTALERAMQTAGELAGGSAPASAPVALGGEAAPVAGALPQARPALPPPPQLPAVASASSEAPHGESDGNWLKLAAAGDHRRAFSLAEKRGITKLTQRLNAPDLLLLADTARYVHQPASAAQAFLALATRFPNAPESTDALFGLGRMAFQDGQWPDAARWFRKVVEQRRDGPLIEAAWGRLLESLDRASDPGAGAAASNYLTRFPSGHHRALAERIRGGRLR